MLSATGCGPGAIEDGDGSGTGTAGSTSATTPTGATAASTMGEPSTSAGSTSAGSTSTGSTSAGSTGADSTEGTETGEDACPPPERILADFTVSPDEPIASPCTVMAVGGDPGSTMIELECMGQAVTLTVDILPQTAEPSVAAGQLVHLEYVTDQIFWTNRWVALQTAGGETDWLLMGGVSGSALDPPGTTIDAFFGSSIGAPTVAEVDGLCEPFQDRCGDVDRLALDFSIRDDATVRVFDQGADLIDVLAYGYWFSVQTAIRQLRPVGCDDVPPAWYQFVAVWFPSD
jgi:hypothetical protein